MLHSIVLPVLMGLAVFLFGMKMMEAALHRWAGPYLQRALQSTTRTPWRGMVSGTVMTALLQSSTAVTVITIGLVNARLLTFPRTLGIILGTNIGTCLTTELIGLSINRLAVPLLIGSLISWAAAVTIDALLYSLNRNEPDWTKPVQYFALATAGFAFVLFGVSLMQSIGPALETQGMFAWFIEHARRSLLWGIIAGAAASALLHSSAATIAMAMGLAAAGTLPVDLGIAVVLGANIGTCATALAAAIGGTRGGQFAALAHVTLNAGGALLFYPGIELLEQAVSWMTSQPASQIARAQTIFNIVCSLAALPLCYLPVWRRFRS
jgi:phosphate:Na+ symporter